MPLHQSEDSRARPPPIFNVLHAASAEQPSIVNCTWKYYEQQVDHFGGTDAGTFQQRVCLYSAYHKPEASAPIFFYTGNESPVEEYVNNTGLMWELGKKMSALLVWAEHRFEPETHPNLQGTSNCFAYGTTAQALEDYVQLIGTIRKEFTLPPSTPVISFGGSYGGMLSGWMRIKYPHVLAGAIAASAPVWGLATTMQDERLDWSARAIARGVSKAGGATDYCLTNIRSAWPLIRHIGQSKIALPLLAQSARACKPSKVKSGDALTSWAKSPWFDMSEGNYPFASSYITYAVGPGYINLPPWPVRTACSKGLDQDLGVRVVGDVKAVKYNVSIGTGANKLTVAIDWNESTNVGWSPHTLTEEVVKASGILDLMEGLQKAVGVWYNITGEKECYALRYEDDTVKGMRRVQGASLLREASKQRDVVEEA